MFGFFRRNPLRQSVEALYVELAAASRNPLLFTAAAVPDSFEGRFEVLVLHVALVQIRLKTLADDSDKTAQLLTDCLFADLDAAVREAGVSDVGVPRKMKRLAEAYFGRLAAYEAMMAGGRDMSATLARNVLAAGEQGAAHPGAAILAQYVTAVSEMLREKDLAAILALRSEEMLDLARAPD